MIYQNLERCYIVPRTYKDSKNEYSLYRPAFKAIDRVRDLEYKNGWKQGLGCLTGRDEKRLNGAVDFARRRILRSNNIVRKHLNGFYSDLDKARMQVGF